LDVIDYLLKPVPFDSFLKAANKAMEYYIRESRAEKVENDKTNLFIKSEHKIIKIAISDIDYIESLKDYIKIYCNNKPILTLMSLKSIEANLPPDKFIRVHRSYIISIEKINYISRSKVFIGEKAIPISNSYRDSITRLLSE